MEYGDIFMRILGLDIGDKTIGVAVECDEQMAGVLAAVATSGKYGKTVDRRS